MSSLMLVCAVVASLAVGVFTAQGLCVLMFRVFRLQVEEKASSAKAQVAELGRIAG
jgi:hypothetical protein